MIIGIVQSSVDENENSYFLCDDQLFYAVKCAEYGTYSYQHGLLKSQRVERNDSTRT